MRVAEGTYCIVGLESCDDTVIRFDKSANHLFVLDKLSENVRHASKSITYA